MNLQDITHPPTLAPVSSLKEKLHWLLRKHFMAQFHGEYRRAILSMLEIKEDARLLDLGCGDGRFSKEMAKIVGTSALYGFDRLDWDSIGFQQIVGDLNEPLPLESESFDAVVASQVIEHLSDTDIFIKEAYRVLRPLGYFIVSTDNLASLHNIMYLLWSKQPEPCGVSDEMGLSYKRPGHRRIFTIQALYKLLRYHGFKVERIIGSSYYPLPLPLARFMCKVDKWHSRTITVKARKEKI